jgi:GNAT superfamily N-acetyltransferase
MDKLKLRRSARKDSIRIEELVYDDYYQRIPVLDGFSKKEELVCKKVVDEDGNIIAGCGAYIYGWGGCYIDDMWVDEKYRRHGLGSHALQAVEKAAEERGCHLLWVGTWDFQARPYYEKHGYRVFTAIQNCPLGHTDYNLFKLVDKNAPKRPLKPIDYEVVDGNEKDEEFIGDQLDNGYNAKHLDIKHDYIKINRKLVNEKGEVVAAIMAGNDDIDVGWIFKIWVDEKYRNQGLGTRLVRHFEKKAKETGATKILSMEIYDWNVGFFLKNGYKIAGELKDLPKGHRSFILEKDL